MQMSKNKTHANHISCEGGPTAVLWMWGFLWTLLRWWTVSNFARPSQWNISHWFYNSFADCWCISKFSSNCWLLVTLLRSWEALNLGAWSEAFFHMDLSVCSEALLRVKEAATRRGGLFSCGTSAPEKFSPWGLGWCCPLFLSGRKHFWFFSGWRWLHSVAVIESLFGRDREPSGSLTPGGRRAPQFPC